MHKSSAQVKKNFDMELSQTCVPWTTTLIIVHTLACLLTHLFLNGFKFAPVIFHYM